MRIEFECGVDPKRLTQWFGQTLGRTDGMADGMAAGQADGIADGMADGMADGVAGIHAVGRTESPCPRATASRIRYSLTPLGMRTLGCVSLPRTLVCIEGEDSEAKRIYDEFYLHFMSAGG